MLTIIAAAADPTPVDPGMVNGQRVATDAVPCCRLMQGSVVRVGHQETPGDQAALKLLVMELP